MRKLMKRFLIVLVLVLIAIQFVPVDFEGAAAEAPLVAPAEVQAILERSCYDCHAADPNLPWYSSVAPVSFLVAHDIEEGREHLDFSNWGKLDPEKQKHALEEIVEEVEEGEMPLEIYTLMHGDAKLSAEDIAVLRAWAGVPEGKGGEHEDADHEDGEDDD